MSQKKESVVVLLSGGMDSAVVAAMALERNFDVSALTFDYNQRHRYELLAATNITHSLGISRHMIFKLDLSQIGGSALTSDIAVPKHQPPCERIPITYVPARNTIFLSVALGWAETQGATRVFIGANAIDYSGYPDCRPEYITAFQQMANLATKSAVEGNPVRIESPLLTMSKGEIIRQGTRLGVDFSLTSSCYEPTLEGHACGECDSCCIRQKGFAEAGIPDPTTYVILASS